MAATLIKKKYLLKIDGKDVELKEPMAGCSIEQVRSYNQVQYPVLANAAYEQQKDGSILFKTFVGTKG